MTDASDGPDLGQKICCAFDEFRMHASTGRERPDEFVARVFREYVEGDLARGFHALYWMLRSRSYGYQNLAGTLLLNHKIPCLLELGPFLAAVWPNFNLSAGKTVKYMALSFGWDAVADAVETLLLHELSDDGKIRLCGILYQLGNRKRSGRACFKLDYYEGGTGPTVLLRGETPLSISILRDLFLDLARQPSRHVSLRNVDGFDVAQDLNLILEHREEQCEPHEGLILLTESIPRIFVLRFDESGWTWCAGLMDGLGGHPGHQYLAEGNPAMVKVSLLEYPWKKSFRE